ncbi:MAG: CBS domain-containing protein [Gammaproteobacteria bacterium]|nr:CBS domain-containing protein [Gammaproteobacteria bacterium]MBU1732954.1 CBS domain-containing protein [Gammaproteobacteria bacterium]MBU1892002.1 CBS domain-containing protein [Gammaproteobacteria bacterium]
MSHPGSPPNALILATLDHLTRFAPFDRMESEHLEWLASRLEVGYYAKGEIVLSPEQGEAHTFFLIKQGIVQGEQGVVQAQEDAAWLELHEGECFPLGALLSKRPVTSVYRAQEDVFCYELKAQDFLALTHKSEAFHDFCTRRIANLLEQSKHIIQAQYSQSSAEQQSMSSPLSAIIRREPIACDPQTPLREVLESMQRLGIGSMVAVDVNHRPVGIFTLHDVLARVTLPGLNLDTPLASVMSPDPFTLPPHALVHEAALAMAKHGFRHILMVENGRLKGLVSEKDLFSLQRVGLRQISGAIRNAERLECLQQSALDIRELAHNMLAQGVAAEQLTQIISTLNDVLTNRIIELELRDNALADIEFCWLALGSEGRIEQTLNTDQDNGLIFSVPMGSSAEEVRARLLPFAKRINNALAECGFPLCGGDVMASNPKWCLSLDEWKDTFDKWIYHGAPMDLLHSTIFFDFRHLFGAEHLADSLRKWLSVEASKNSRFLHQLAANALKNRPPLGMVRDFVIGEGHTLDLKLNGITPFVDAARIYSLAHSIAETNTLQRLRGIAEPLNIKPQDADAYCDAFLFIQLLRLRLHHEQTQRGEKLTNRVDPDNLNNLDQRILKEAFRQARKLQTKLGLDYQV